MNNNRIKIINSEIQKALGEIIIYGLNNPQITGIISVIKVETSPDLDACKVFLSVFTPGDDRLEVFNQIKHSATHIRRELAKKINLRQTPYLNFILDNSFEDRQKIDDLIAKTKQGANIDSE